MRTLNKIKIAIAALFVGLLGMAPLASFSQNENGVTDQGESTTKVNGSYVNENGKFVCWPRVTSYGKLLTYGPVVTTDSVNSITSTTATLYGNVVHDGWCGVTEQGFEVSTDANFTAIVVKVVMNPQPSFTPCIYPACLCAGNEYHKEVTGLTAGTHYYYRAYAKNPCDPDPSYGDTLAFDTPGAGYVVEVTGPSPVQFCPGGSQSATYTASVTPAMTTPTYQWYLDGALVAGETSSTYTTTFSVTGTYAVKCEITEGGSTVDGTKSVTVSNYTVPPLAISGDASICAGATGNLTASTGFDSYDWSSNVYSSTANEATYKNAGTYTVTATTSDGCTATASTSVTVTNPNLAGTFSASSANICSGDNASLTATYTGSYSGTLSYQWYQGSGASKSALSGKTSSTLDLTAPVTADDYTCVLTHTLNGCNSTMEAVGNITVNTVSVDITSLTAAANPVCSGESTTVTPTMGSYSGTLSYAWSTGASGTGVPGAITTGALTSNTTYTLTVTATTGSCSVTATKSITITVTNTSATTNNVASVTCVSATLSGRNTACSDARGFVYSSTNSTPTVGGTGCTNISVTNGTGSFTNALSGLTPNTTYYVQAYSHSGSSYFYGGVKSFTTEEITLTMHAQDDTINLCQEPKQAVVTISATPDCDADNAGNNYAWSLSTTDPYTVAADGKSITVTVTSTTLVNVSATCTLTHPTGYTTSATDYSIIRVEGNPPEICICEDAFAGTTTITSIANISSVEWYQGANADTDNDSPISALHNTGTISTSSYTEGYYTILATSPLGCKNTRTVALGFPYKRCAPLGTTGNTTETISGGGVKQITDGRTANGNSATTYRVVQIGGQCWMAENLRYKQIEDGRSSAYSQNDLINTSIYDYRMYFTWPSSKTLSKGDLVSDTWLTQRYGYLYTWIGVMDAPATMATRSTMYPYQQIDFRVQGICPDGWHLPTDGEWFQLEKEMGVTAADSAVVITSMRHENDIEGTVHDILQQGASRGYAANAGTQAASGCEWYIDGSDDCPEDYCNIQRNTTGFSAMPAGVFVPQYPDRDACFQILGSYGTYWSASQALSAHAGHDDFSDAAYVHQLKASQGGWDRYRADKHNGLSVRCVRDLVTTTAATSINHSSAVVGGTVLEDANYPITECGICWSNNGTVSIAGPHRASAPGVGPFTMTLTSSDIPSGEYQYCAYAINEKGVYYGLTQTVQLPSLPEVVTGKTSDINATNSTITLHGEVTSNGGYPATTRGICWSTNSTPTISDNVVPDGTGTGAYSVTITSGLNSSTTYYYRAYATNPEGTAYGEVKLFVLDPCAGINKVNYDGTDYNTSRIGTQCWLSTSLHVDNYADGTAVPRGSAPDGSNVGMKYSDVDAYYYEAYNVAAGHNQAVIDNWGRLYNWQAATRVQVYNGTPVQGICPYGWHVPTYSEVETLMIGAATDFGTLPYHWAYLVCHNNTWAFSAVLGSPGWAANDQPGAGNPRTTFSAYPTGMIHPSYAGNPAVAQYTVPEAQNTWFNMWCSDTGTGGYPQYCAISNVTATDFTPSNGAPGYSAYGFSVRCVKD